MCFSPDADAVVGGIVVVIGVDALRHVREPKQILLASLPLLFGLHQLDEAFVWLGTPGPRLGIARAGRHLGLPALRARPRCRRSFPLAVLAIERSPGAAAADRACSRRSVSRSACRSASSMFRGSVNAAIDGRHIAYDVERVAVRAVSSPRCTSSPRAARSSLCSYRDIAAARRAESRRGAGADVDDGQRLHLAVVLLGRDRERRDRLPPAAPATRCAGDARSRARSTSSNVT